MPDKPSTEKGLFSSASLRERLLKKKPATAHSSNQNGPLRVNRSYSRYTSFENYEGYQEVLKGREIADKNNITPPFFRLHEGLATATTPMHGKTCINYASYNYLNLNGDTRVNQAAKAAIDRYGTSVSASRIVSGERPPQQALEQAIAQTYAVDDAVVFVSGHATNVSTIGYLFGPDDMVIHDELIHNSVLEGIRLSGAKRMFFKHNSHQQLGNILARNRHHFKRVLIVIEGIYSMDGDFPELPEFIRLKQEYGALLMVDEAHSLGVIGKTGKGISEHYGVDANDIDIWMGTLSKTLCGCGGYIAGTTALVEHLRYRAPGFLYSVGIPCPTAAASHKALQLMHQEPQRIEALQQISRFFLERARAYGFNTGNSQGYGVIVVMAGNSRKAVTLSNRLLEHDINVQPIIYPAVEANQARLRFFMNCSHTEQQVETTLQALKALL